MTKQADTVENKVEIPIHDLFSREIRPPRNWKEWLECWQRATTTFEMLGLLHFGFQVSMSKASYNEVEYKEIDRLRLYFKIADGWKNSYHVLRHSTDSRDGRYQVIDSEDNVVYLERYILREQLARKAFDVLCANFFHPDNLRVRGNDRYAEFWLEWILGQELLPIIQNFFRMEDRFRSMFDLVNLPDEDNLSNNEKQVVSFVERLTEFVFTFEAEAGNASPKILERLRSVKPWIVQLLAAIRRLDLLRCWTSSLSDECILVLRLLAMKKSFNRWDNYTSDERPVANIDEACLLGSEAAWLVKRHELFQRETKRLRELRRAEEERDEAEERLKSLQAKAGFPT